MKLPAPNQRRIPASLLLFIVALGVFASPFTASWAGFRPPWFLPYLLWGGLIALGALFLRDTPGDDR